MQEEAVRAARRAEEARATLQEVWALPALCKSGGFAMVVDSDNVAGWLSGRRKVLPCAGWRQTQEEREEALVILELLCMHFCGSPLATEWVFWARGKLISWLMRWPRGPSRSDLTECLSIAIGADSVVGM